MRVALLLAVFFCLVTSAPASADGNVPSQPLFIAINGQGAVAKSLEQYTPGAPIAVHVSALHAADIDAVGLIAMGPSGSPLRTTLKRSADGTFAGVLALNETGTWTLTVSERTGTLTTETSPIGLDVDTLTPDTSGPIAFAAGAFLFLALGGFGFIALRRRATMPAHARAA